MNVNAKAKAKKGLADDSHAQIAYKAMEATGMAYRRALTSSHGVLRVEGGRLVRELKDGTRLTVGKAEPRRKVKTGKVVLVRRVEPKEARSTSA